MEKRDNIKVDGHKGTWYVVDEAIVDGRAVYLLEHEQYGEDAACLIVDDNLTVLMDDVWNGIDELGVSHG